MQNSNDGFGEWFPIRKGDFSITESFTLNRIPPLMKRTSSHHSTHFIPTKKKKRRHFSRFGENEMCARKRLFV